MAQKNASPARRQARILEKRGLSRLTWSVIRELKYTLVVRHRITGEVRYINK